MSNHLLAFVFPGQGSQAVGMLGKLAAESPIIRQTFDEASRVLGYDLWQLCQQGPAEDLNATEKTQPAMLVAGIATWRLWQERQGALPAIVTGHSLGEFTALVAAGAIDFTGCVDLVRFRGKVMQEAVPAGTGAMAALLGLEDGEVEAACREATRSFEGRAGAVVEAVNFNSPGQVVIAGEKAAVLRAIEVAKSKGAKRAIELPVSVPSHSSLMKSAGVRLGERLASTEIRAPRIRYLSAVDAHEHSSPDEIRALLVSQLSSPVRWTATVAALGTAGVRQVIECGPGGVLTGLVKRITRGGDMQTLALESPENFTPAA
jgi:[acyl-carrier-protein] S-malonyltransferase